MFYSLYKLKGKAISYYTKVKGQDADPDLIEISLKSSQGLKSGRRGKEVCQDSELISPREIRIGRRVEEKEIFLVRKHDGCQNVFNGGFHHIQNEDLQEEQKPTFPYFLPLD